MAHIRVAVLLTQGQMNGTSGWVGGFYYVRNCLDALAMLPPGEAPSVTVFVPASFGDDILLPEFQEHAPWLNIVYVPGHLLDGSAGPADLQRFFDQYEFDIVFPALLVPPVVISARWIGWIPDLQHKHYPQLFDQNETSKRDSMFAFLTSFCHLVACSSETVKQDLCTFYPAARERCAILRFSSILPSTAYQGDPRPVLSRFGLTRKYAFLPNQFWVHKNHRLVFEAWKRLRDCGREFLLVCTGQAEDYRAPGYARQLHDYICDQGLQEHIRLLGFVPRDDQLQLYRGAAIVLQPSLFEGWSTSIEDAKSLGKQLVISDIPVHREQLGTNGKFFVKDSAEHLAHVLDALWDDLPEGHDRQAEVIAHGEALAEGRAFGYRLNALLKQVAQQPRSANAEVLPMLAWYECFLSNLERYVHTIETDRAARLEVIHRQSDEIERLQAQLAVRRETVDVLFAQLRSLQKKMAGSLIAWPKHLLTAITRRLERW